VLSFDVREQPGETVTVWMSGELSGEVRTDHVLEFLEEHYVNEGVRTIVLDLSELEFIDLEGVATLLTLLRKSGERGKAFAIRGARGHVREKLRTTGVIDRLENNSGSG
jgi:anti-anti-sigma factor